MSSLPVVKSAPPKVVVLGLVLCLLVVACSSPAESLAATLPTRVGDTSFDPVRVIDESFQSGHPIDDVLISLGKRRQDATVVSRDAVDGSISIEAARIDGVTGVELLSATVQNWLSPAVRERSQRTIAGRDVWLIDIRPNHLLAAYARGSVVYLVSTDHLDLIELALPSMP